MSGGKIITFAARDLEPVKHFAVIILPNMARVNRPSCASSPSAFSHILPLKFLRNSFGLVDQIVKRFFFLEIMIAGVNVGQTDHLV